MLALTAVGCAAPTANLFVEPALGAPHAVVIVENDFQVRPGREVQKTVSIDAQTVPMDDGISEQRMGLRAPPGPGVWRVAARFFHTQWVQRLETESYSDSEWVSCASRDYNGNCQSGTRTVYKTRQVLKDRVEDVVDGFCRAAARYELLPGRQYRLVYHLKTASTCSLSCVDETDRTSPMACTSATGVDVPSESEQDMVTSSVIEKQYQDATAPPPRPLAGVTKASMIIGTLGVITGGLAGAVALGNKKGADDHCTDVGTCDEEGLKHARYAKTASTVSTATLIGGGALLALGIGLEIWGPRGTRSTAHVAVSNDGARLSVGGSF